MFQFFNRHNLDNQIMMLWTLEVPYQYKVIINYFFNILTYPMLYAGGWQHIAIRLNIIT
jgi:hypothetical protein